MCDRGTNRRLTVFTLASGTATGAEAFGSSAFSSARFYRDREARVFAAFFAAAERSFFVRFAALECACRDSASFEPAALPSCFRADLVARARRGEILCG